MTTYFSQFYCLLSQFYLTLTVLCRRYYDAYVMGEGSAALRRAMSSDLTHSSCPAR